MCPLLLHTLLLPMEGHFLKSFCSLDSDDDYELLAMLGDGLAHWIHENPDKYRSGRRFMRRVLEDFYPDWIAYMLDGWKMRLVGCAALFGVLYGFAAIMQQIGA